MEEKRWISRVAYRKHCSLSVAGQAHPCIIHNISLTGLLVEVSECLDLVEGTRVSLLMEQFCPECILSEIECHIVRRSGCLLGLQVSAIDYDTFEKIRDILVALIPEKGVLDQEIINLLECKKEKNPDVQ